MSSRTCSQADVVGSRSRWPAASSCSWTRPPSRPASSARVVWPHDTVGLALEDQRWHSYAAGRGTRADGQPPELGDGRGRQPHVLAQLGAHLWAVEVQVGGRSGEELAQLGIIERRTMVEQADTRHEVLHQLAAARPGARPGRAAATRARPAPVDPAATRRQAECQGPAHGVPDQHGWRVARADVSPRFGRARQPFPLADVSELVHGRPEAWQQGCQRGDAGRRENLAERPQLGRRAGESVQQQSDPAAGISRQLERLVLRAGEPLRLRLSRGDQVAVQRAYPAPANQRRRSPRAACPPAPSRPDCGPASRAATNSASAGRRRFWSWFGGRVGAARCVPHVVWNAFGRLGHGASAPALARDTDAPRPGGW